MLREYRLYPKRRIIQRKRALSRIDCQGPTVKPGLLERD